MRSIVGLSEESGDFKVSCSLTCSYWVPQICGRYITPGQPSLVLALGELSFSCPISEHPGRLEKLAIEGMKVKSRRKQLYILPIPILFACPI